MHDKEYQKCHIIPSRSVTNRVNDNDVINGFLSFGIMGWRFEVNIDFVLVARILDNQYQQSVFVLDLYM